MYRALWSDGESERIYASSYWEAHRIAFTLTREQHPLAFLLDLQPSIA